MRLLVVAPEYPPHVIGGGGVVYARIVNHLASRGHTVSVVFGDFGNLSPLADVRQAGDAPPGVARIEVPLLPNPRRLGWMLSAMPPTPRAARTLARMLARRRWDVAHLHGVGFPLVDLCASALRRSGVPYLFSVHGIPRSPFQRNCITRWAAAAYLNRVTRRTVNGASVVTAVSPSLLNDRNFPIRRGHVIPNGIDIRTDPAPVAAARGRAGRPLRLLSASRLSLNKGIDIAIRAVAALSWTRAVEYDIYGADGGDEREFRVLVDSLAASGNIRFCGVFEPAARERLFSQYDALLMPSRVEGFGLAALEALAAGLPIIANPVDGLTTFLSDENAVLVRAPGAGPWAEAISRLADGQGTAGRIEAGLETVRKFSWRGVLDSYETALANVARAG